MTSATIRIDVLMATVERMGEPEAVAWFHDKWPGDNGPPSETKMRVVFSGIGRRLEGGGIAPDAATIQGLREIGIADPKMWSCGGMARAALLLRWLDLSPEDKHVALVRGIFLRGDFGEQAAVLRALPLLPKPERFVEMAIDACRTNVLDVFEAIACENTYAAEHFPDLNFNQLVLKAYFMGVAVARIVGLDKRNTDELRRMASDFASERRAAGRPAPSDIDLVLDG